MANNLEEFQKSLLAAQENLESSFVEQFDKYRINYFKDTREVATKGYQRSLIYLALKHVRSDDDFLEESSIRKKLAQSALAFFGGTLTQLKSDPKIYKKFSSSIRKFEKDVERDRTLLGKFVEKLLEFQYCCEWKETRGTLIQPELMRARLDLEGMAPDAERIYMTWFRETVVVSGIRPDETGKPGDPYTT